MDIMSERKTATIQRARDGRITSLVTPYNRDFVGVVRGDARFRYLGNNQWCQDDRWFVDGSRPLTPALISDQQQALMADLVAVAGEYFEVREEMV